MLLPAVWMLMMMRQLDTGTGRLCVSLLPPKRVNPSHPPPLPCTPFPSAISNYPLTCQVTQPHFSVLVLRHLCPRPLPPVLFTCVCVQFQKILDITTQPIKRPSVLPRQSNLASRTPLRYFLWPHVSSPHPSRPLTPSARRG